MHSLAIGMTESGKTTLCKILARNLKAKGKKIAVLDPIGDPDWNADFQTENPNKLVAYLQRERSVYFFIDESGAVFNEGRDLTYAWFATRSRHYGHSGTFLCQRVIQVPRTMRDQCSRLFLFTSSIDDGVMLAREWNKPEIVECNILPALHFYWVSKYSTSEKWRITSNLKGIERVNRFSGPSHNNRSARRIAHNGSYGGTVDLRKGEK